MADKPVLFKITNLKQHFPLKKKGLYVKANDGINLNIYDGEVLGLVGESGCGKSTLGRTLLRLYDPTDGKIMYYGRLLTDFAPEYLGRTISRLSHFKDRMNETQKALDQKQAEVDKLSTQEQYKHAQELTELKRRAHDAMLDITNILGGLASLDNLEPVAQVYAKLNQCAKEKRGLVLKRQETLCDLNDSRYRLEQKNKDTPRIREKIQAGEAALEALDKGIAAADEKIEAVKREIDQLRAPHLDDPAFKALDEHWDSGVDLSRLTYEEMRTLRVDMQLIFQDPYSSLNPRITVGQIISEGMKAHKLFKHQDDRVKESVLKVMDNCGLAPYFLHRYPHQFSGGQRQRIGIARALALHPKFVVCDEAVSALDVSIQSQIINLLQDLKEQENLTYLFITHDLAVVKYISDRIAVMYLGVIVELASTQDIFSCPMHPYTEALLSAIPTADENEKRELVVLEGDIPSPVNSPKGCKFHTRCKYATDICSMVEPEFTEITPNHFVACHHRLSSVCETDFSAAKAKADTAS